MKAKLILHKFIERAKEQNLRLDYVEFISGLEGQVIEVSDEYISVKRFPNEKIRNYDGHAIFESELERVE